MKEALTEVGDFKIGRRIINKVRFAKTQEELQDMVNRLVNTERSVVRKSTLTKSQVIIVSGVIKICELKYVVENSKKLIILNPRQCVNKRWYCKEKSRQ